MNEQLEPPTNDLDLLLEEILGDCLEAYCEDCGTILATGTKNYHDLVANVGYDHEITFDHYVTVQSWLD
jgi:hypothetical protein